MFWADEIAEKIISRPARNDQYRVHDYKTPSGRIHVGALCGVVIHGVITRAIESRNKKAHFAYGFDDYDPMDGFPVYLPDSFKQYMGMPLSEIPSPEPGFKSFAQYYAKDFITVFNKLGFFPEILWTSEQYKAGFFNEAIKISLDNADVIRKIYKDISGANKPSDWFALSVVCPKCGKVGTTRVFEWDGQEVSFTCEKSLVKWAAGCGYTGKISPYDGQAKLPWKVEWAAKWFLFGEDFETAGKDHMTKNGSHDVAAAIARQVYIIEPPLGREYPYEWLLIGGRKMSTSKGTGASAKEVIELLPPHLLAFFIAKAKINRHREFSPDGTTMPLLYDEFDKAIVAHHTEPENDLAKALLYTKPENWMIPDYTMRFSKIAFLSQMPNVDIWHVAKEEKGSDLSASDKKELQDRLDYAKKWLTDLAPEEMKFTLQNKLPTVDLSPKQKEFLHNLLDVLEQNNWEDGNSIHKSLHDLRQTSTIDPKEAFGAIYQIFLARDSGPQAGWFLNALGKDFVISRLKEAITV